MISRITIVKTLRIISFFENLKRKKIGMAWVSQFSELINLRHGAGRAVVAAHIIILCSTVAMLCDTADLVRHKHRIFDPPLKMEIDAEALVVIGTLCPILVDG